MYDELDNTGEEVELDPVLDEEDFQDTDLDDEDDDVTGQDDFDDADDDDDEDFEDGDGEETETDGNESDNSRSDEGKTPLENADKTTTKKPLSSEENAVNAARRRREELDAKLKEEHNRTVISVLGGKNPYTGKEMTDGHDVEVYERMQRIKEAGGDPIADYASTLAEEQRKAEKEAKETSGEDFNAWARKDASQFKTANPDVDISTLMKDKTFLTIANPLLKNRMPMTEIYKLYQQTVSNIDSVNRTAKEKVKEAVAGKLANEKASAGSLKANGQNSTGLYTREQLNAMSDEELDANWDKVQRSYAALGGKK